MKVINNLKTKSDFIENLKELFITARQAQIVYKNEINIKDLGVKFNEYKSWTDETKKIVDSLFDYSISNTTLDDYIRKMHQGLDELLHGDDEDMQIHKLRIIIEKILFEEFDEMTWLREEESPAEIGKTKEFNRELNRQKKLKETIDGLKEYYRKAIESLEPLQNKDYEEQIILKLYNESEQLKIYIDAEKENDFQYGDFLDSNELANLVLYQDENMTLTRLANYTARKTNRIDKGKILAHLTQQEISKYKYDLFYEKGKKASIVFFAETSIGDKILRGSKRNFLLLIAAACEAKERKRQFVGRISCLDREVGTFITTYDDNLEAAVQNTIEKENKICKKEVVKSGEKKETSPEEQLGERSD